MKCIGSTCLHHGGSLKRGFWGFLPLSFSIENTGFINSYQPFTSRKNFAHGQQNLQTEFAQCPGSTQHSCRQVCPSTAGSSGDRELHSFHQALRNLPGFHCQCREQCHCCVRLHNVAISSKVHQYYPEQHSHSLSTPSSFWDIELDGVVPVGGTSGHWETTGVQELWILQSSSITSPNDGYSQFPFWWLWRKVPVQVCF